MATKKHPLTVLFFSPYFYPYISGLTQYPYRLFAQSDLPIQTTCLTFRHDRKSLQEEQINSRLKILRMPFSFRLSKGFISPQSPVYFWHETKKNDIVMINLPSIEGILLAIFALMQRKPLISLLHCEVLLPFSLSNIIVNFVLNCGVFIQLSLSKKIIVYTRDYYEGKWMYSFFKDKMEVILPPVHTSAPDISYSLELEKIKSGYDLVVGFCGRIAAEKGIEIIAQSVSTLKNTLILFAGPTGKDVVGEVAYFSKIVKILESNKIPHIFLGTLSAGKLSSFYKAIDVLVLPSLNKTEAFGMVQVEAMLQGTPVIASDLPGVRVPILTSRMGILTPAYGVEELTTALMRMRDAKSQYANDELTSNAKRLFDPQKAYDSIYTIIQP